MNSNPTSSIPPQAVGNRSMRLAVATALCLGALSQSMAAPSTVGVLNPNPNALTIQDSPANSAHPNFLTQSAMSSLVLSAFNNNQGGVVTWDTAQGWGAANTQNALSHTVTYGTAQSSMLTITRADGGGLNTFGPSTGGGSVPTSGDQYVGFQTLGSPMTLTFDQGLTAWGITQLNRNASRTVTLSFTLADTTVITYNPETQDPAGNSTGPLNWYGFQASQANPITKVTMTANGFTRFDDMAFIVVPEPSAAALLGLSLAGVAVLRRRK